MFRAFFTKHIFISSTLNQIWTLINSDVLRICCDHRARFVHRLMSVSTVWTSVHSAARTDQASVKQPESVGCYRWFHFLCGSRAAFIFAGSLFHRSPACHVQNWTWNNRQRVFHYEENKGRAGAAAALQHWHVNAFLLARIWTNLSVGVKFLINPLSECVKET